MKNTKPVSTPSTTISLHRSLSGSNLSLSVGGGGASLGVSCSWELRGGKARKVSGVATVPWGQSVAAPQVPLTSLFHRVQMFRQKQNSKPLAYSSKPQLRLGSSQSQKQGAQSRSPSTYASLLSFQRICISRKLQAGANLRHSSRGCGPHVEMFYHSEKPKTRPKNRWDHSQHWVLSSQNHSKSQLSKNPNQEYQAGKNWVSQSWALWGRTRLGLKGPQQRKITLGAELGLLHQQWHKYTKVQHKTENRFL